MSFSFFAVQVALCSFDNFVAYNDKEQPTSAVYLTVNTTDQ